MKKIIYYFTADWCTPCKKVRPLLLEVMQEFPDVEFRIVDAEYSRGEVVHYNVQSIPVLVNPNTHSRIQAQANKDALRYSITQLLEGQERADQ
jgi:thiol-disulfide isomerase/thioredoxin